MPDRTDVTDEGDGPAVLCLHGFPQNQAAFDGVAKLLVSAGYRVIRFDQRGYDGNILPRRQYVTTELARDAIRVLDDLGVQDCIVVGHDLGGMVGWELARLAPDRVIRLFVLAVPHPGAFLLSLFGVKQVVRSWYFLVAQSTRVAKVAFSPADPRSRARFLNQLASTGLREAEAARYLSFLTPLRFVGSIRWYQAMPFSSPRSSFTLCRSEAVVVWGTRDAISTSLSISMSKWFMRGKESRIVRISSAGHWLLDYNAQAIADLVAGVPGRSI